MEYGFELALCATLERETDWVLARQLGAAVAAPSQRVIDVVGVVPGPEFDARAEITAETIPAAAIEADVGVGRARRPETAFDCHPQRRSSAVEAALDCGFFERERVDGHDAVRQTARYPDDWVDELVGIENKPDLDRPGELARQLRLDASLALFDRVVLATASHATRAHCNRLPDPVGLWEFDPETGERTVVREPEQLPADEPGIEPLGDASDHTEVAVVGRREKRRRRRRVAERAYGKGWRPAQYPACAHCAPDEDGLPYCTAFERVVAPNEDCGEHCPRRDPTNPPDLDPRRLRADRTPWVAEPSETTRRQTGLDRFW